MCLGHGPRYAASFTVRIRFTGRPLPGALVTVTPFAPSTAPPVVMTTGTDGLARFHDLPPGNYDLNAMHLGLDAGGGCFHVGSGISLRARHRITFDWGESPHPVRPEARGSLAVLVPDPDRVGVMRSVYPLRQPVPGATIEWSRPGSSDAAASAASEPDGTFPFPKLPAGVYVLTVSGGTTPPAIEPTPFLIQITASAPDTPFALVNRSAIASSCGPPRFELLTPPRTTPSTAPARR